MASFFFCRIPPASTTAQCSRRPTIKWLTERLVTVATKVSCAWIFLTALANITPAFGQGDDCGQVLRIRDVVVSKLSTMQQYHYLFDMDEDTFKQEQKSMGFSAFVPEVADLAYRSKSVSEFQQNLKQLVVTDYAKTSDAYYQSSAFPSSVVEAYIQCLDHQGVGTTAYLESYDGGVAELAIRWFGVQGAPDSLLVQILIDGIGVEFTSASEERIKLLEKGIPAGQNRYFTVLAKVTNPAQGGVIELQSTMGTPSRSVRIPRIAPVYSLVPQDRQPFENDYTFLWSHAIPVYAPYCVSPPGDRHFDLAKFSQTVTPEAKATGPYWAHFNEGQKFSDPGPDFNNNRACVQLGLTPGAPGTDENHNQYNVTLRITGETYTFCKELVDAPTCER